MASPAMSASQQKEFAARFGALYVPVDPSERVGIALATLALTPLNAVRHPAENGTCGWYIWGGEMSQADDFFQALCVEHLPERCPEIVPYLGLAPGWGVVLAPDYEDVWYDEKLLAI
jgi:hypothetical protein